MSLTNELRVFISSTFRDLQEEREHLIKKIFPEIRALCRERGVTFTEVDLRWGLTEEQAVHGTVIRTCLEEIDKCRPYFIGMIGGRYGWVPELYEVMIDPELLAKYPWIEDATHDGTSVTEMEFIHGVFAHPEMAANAAFFYHRSGDATDVDGAERLRSLIDRARATGHPFRDFGDVEQLGKQVRADLVAMIEIYWPEQSAPSALELERRAHAAFAASRKRAYIPNPAYLKEFSVWVAGEGYAEVGDAVSVARPLTPLVIGGASGLGKSSLVAYLVESYRRKYPTAFVVEHYVGASQTSGSALAVMRHVIGEIRERFAIDEQMPEKPEEIERSFPNWLFRLEHLAAQQEIKVLLIIDALNQLDAVGRRLAWLPMTIPTGVKLMISTTPSETDDQLSKREWSRMEVTPIEDERLRQSIIARYLGEFHKGVSVEQLRQLTSDAKAASPLYLRVVAEELRLHGEYETLDEEIVRHTSASDLDYVFQGVLQRLEHDYSEATVRRVLESIWASRSGISEVELLEMLALTRLELSRLLSALDYHLLRKDGLLGFFHDYLRRAVEKRYLGDAGEKRGVFQRLVDHFESEAVTLRATQEIVHALESLGERVQLEGVLAGIERFNGLWAAERQEVLRLWSASEVATVAAAYREGLERWQQQAPSRERRAELLAAIAELLDYVGGWPDAEELQRERVELLRVIGDRVGESYALSSLAGLARLLGRVEAAEHLARQAEEIAREVGDHQSLAKAVGSRGNVHLNRNEYTEALACYREQEEIARELGDRKNIAVAVGNRGIVHRYRGEYTEALACYREQAEIAQELGDRRIIAGGLQKIGSMYSEQGEHDKALHQYEQALSLNRSIGNRQGIGTNLGGIGHVHSTHRKYAEALACYREQEEIARQLSDRQSIGIAVGSRGTVHWRRGEYSEALACYREQEEIGRELGDRRVIANAVNNRGNVHADCGEYCEALACFQQSEAEHRAIRYQYGLVELLGGIAQVLVELAEAGGEMPKWLSEYVPGAAPDSWHGMALQRARKAVEECLSILQELSRPDILFSSNVLLSRIDAADGDTDVALEHLHQMLQEATDDDERAELHYWLWRVGRKDGEEERREENNEHHTEGLRLYELLIAKTPKHAYNTRIKELKTSGDQA